ncbi:MAG: oxygenase MpaB family protein [Anaerolineae bacterium]
MTQSVLEKIAPLDAKADHQEITRIVTAYEYPFLMQKALEFALFRTYAVPTIGALLDKTKHFERAGQKRYDDTALLIAEWVENGYDSEHGRAALRRMNQLHHRWEIANDDYLYVLSVFIYVPVEWYAMYGTRALTEKETHALYYFWVEVGKRMGIKNIPDSYEAFEQFYHDYERKHFIYSDESRRVADATIQIFLNWYPAFIRPVVLQAIYALMDDPLREAFRYPAPPSWFTAMVRGGLRLGARFIRLLPPRRTGYQRTQDRNLTYPHGYKIEEVGATEPIAK